MDGFFGARVATRHINYRISFIHIYFHIYGIPDQLFNSNKLHEMVEAKAMAQTHEYEDGKFQFLIAVASFGKFYFKCEFEHLYV